MKLSDIEYQLDPGRFYFSEGRFYFSEGLGDVDDYDDDIGKKEPERLLLDVTEGDGKKRYRVFRKG